MRAPVLLLLAVTAGTLLTSVGCSGSEPSTTAGSGTTAEPGTTVVTDEVQETVPGLSPDRLPILIARSEIPAGTAAATALRDGSIEPATATRAEFPEDAIIDVELIEGMEAARDIPRDSIITAGMFTAHDSESPTSSSLPSSTSSSS